MERDGDRRECRQSQSSETNAQDRRRITQQWAPIAHPRADASRFVCQAIVDTAERLGISHDVRVALARHLDPACTALVFRSALELVRDACRHSGGRSIVARVASIDDFVRVEVADDGPGWGHARGGAWLRMLAEDLVDAGGRLEPAMLGGRFAAVAHIPTEVMARRPFGRFGGAITA